MTRRSARDFSNDQRVHHHEVQFEQVRQHAIALAEMIDPYRGIDENACQRGDFSRRRGISCICGTVPPRAASRFAA